MSDSYDANGARPNATDDIALRRPAGHRQSAGNTTPVTVLEEGDTG